MTPFDGKLFIYPDSQELFRTGISLASSDECVLLRITVIPTVGLDSNIIVNRSAHDVATADRNITKRTRCSNAPQMATTTNLADAAKPLVATTTTTSEAVAMPVNTLQVKLSSGKKNSFLGVDIYRTVLLSIQLTMNLLIALSFFFC